MLASSSPERLCGGKVDLGRIAGDDRLGTEAESSQEHEHLLRVEFCASSRMMKAWFSVRPRM